MSDGLTEKAVKKSVAFPPTLLADALDRAEKECGGNLSRYVQKLVSQDLGLPSGMPDANNKNCLVDLCERFAPTWVGEMRKRCESVGDQPKALEALLKVFAGGGSGIEPYLASTEDPKS